MENFGFCVLKIKFRTDVQMNLIDFWFHFCSSAKSLSKNSCRVIMLSMTPIPKTATRLSLGTPCWRTWIMHHTWNTCQSLYIHQVCLILSSLAHISAFIRRHLTKQVPPNAHKGVTGGHCYLMDIKMEMFDDEPKRLLHLQRDRSANEKPARSLAS